MFALLILAAETAVHEPKTAFYICGGILAGWAVVISAIGMAAPDFPGSAVVARGVMLITVVLVGFALAAALATA